ncbi:hypothetical protein VPH35_058000 [Triticum aestivum]
MKSLHVFQLIQHVCAVHFPQNVWSTFNTLYLLSSIGRWSQAVLFCLRQAIVRNSPLFVVCTLCKKCSLFVTMLVVCSLCKKWSPPHRSCFLRKQFVLSHMVVSLVCMLAMRCVYACSALLWFPL